jgi:hypothetical protein
MTLIHLMCKHINCNPGSWHNLQPTSYNPHCLWNWMQEQQMSPGQFPSTVQGTWGLEVNVLFTFRTPLSTQCFVKHWVDSGVLTTLAHDSPVPSMTSVLLREPRGPACPKDRQVWNHPGSLGRWGTK